MPGPQMYLKGQGLRLLYVPNNTHRLDIYRTESLHGIELGSSYAVLRFFFFFFSFFFLPHFISLFRSSFLLFGSHWTSLTGLEFAGRSTELGLGIMGIM